MSIELVMWLILAANVVMAGLWGLRKVRGRLREFDKQDRLCDLALLKFRPHFEFSFLNVEGFTSELTKYWWVRFDNLHGMFEVHPDVLAWLSEHAPDHRVENNEIDSTLLIGFSDLDHQFHFKMRWL